MYEGDYTVEAGTHPGDIKNEANGKPTANGGQENIPPPHLRNGSDQVPSVQAPQPQKRTPPRNVPTAHILVYDIATHYKLTELRRMALKKFKKAKDTSCIEDVPAMAKTIYHATESPQDPLRKGFLTLLLTDWSVWLKTDNFVNFLSADAESHEFAMDVIIALVQHLVEKSKQDQSSTEAQATASRLLLSDLNKANEALAKSSSRIKALESELAAEKSENTKLEMEVGSQITAACLLQSDLDQANEELAWSKNSVRKLEAENSKLEVDLKKSKDSLEKYKDKVNIAQAQLQDANEKLKTETARANKSAEKCAINLNLRTQKEQTIRAKDTTIAAEKARTDKGQSIIRSIVTMVNNHAECRHCGESLCYTLRPVDRIDLGLKRNGQPFNSMLRCFMCKTKKYGDYITLG
jgi:hypothetical protein